MDTGSSQTLSLRAASARDLCGLDPENVTKVVVKSPFGAWIQNRLLTLARISMLLVSPGRPRAQAWI